MKQVFYHDLQMSGLERTPRPEQKRVVPVMGIGRVALIKEAVVRRRKGKGACHHPLFGVLRRCLRLLV